MKFHELTNYLQESQEMPMRIGYGVRNVKTHELVKFFNNNRLYQELKDWKKENLDMLDKDYKLTNEIEESGKRTFYFWGTDKHFDVPSQEPDPRPSKKNNRI